MVENGIVSVYRQTTDFLIGKKNKNKADDTSELADWLMGLCLYRINLC